MDTDVIQELLEADHPGWEVVSDCSISCAEHGYSIEWDGQCPEGCVSPLLEMGFI